MNTISKVYVGVDVSKEYLDVYIHPIGRLLKVSNCTTGIANLIKQLKCYHVEMVGFESTGGYQNLLKKLLEQESYPTWLIQAKRVKAFIDSEGINYKTDQSDAKLIALFVSQKKRKDIPVTLSESELEFRAFVSRRDELTRLLCAETNRLQSPMQLYCTDMITEHLQFIKGQIASLEEKIAHVIKQNEVLHARATILQSIPGIGPVTTATLLAHMQELGAITGKKAAALLGVAPFVKHSGTYKGKSTIRAGRVVPRKILYMATLVAIRFNQPIKQFYTRLIAVGKPKKVALVASMRKLLVILNLLLRKGELWNYSVL